MGIPTDDDTASLLVNFRQRFAPRVVLAGGSSDSTSLTDLLAGKESAQSPTLFICRDFACQPPAFGRDASIAALDELEGIGAAAHA